MVAFVPGKPMTDPDEDGNHKKKTKKKDFASIFEISDHIGRTGKKMTPKVISFIMMTPNVILCCVLII